MHVEEHQSLEQLRASMKEQRRVREHRRFHAVLLARQGKTAPEIAGQLSCGRRPVQRWIERYNKGGPAGLAEGKRPGRPARLKAEQEAAFCRRLEAGPQPADGTCAFHGKDLQRILAGEFEVLLTLNAVYGLLHRLGYSRLCPRPRHPQSDSQAQADFKKTRQNR